MDFDKAQTALNIINHSYRGFIKHSSLIKLDTIQQSLIESAEKHDNGDDCSAFVEVKAPFDTLNEWDPCRWTLARAFTSVDLVDLSGYPLSEQLTLAQCYDVVIDCPWESHTVRSWWRIKLSGDNCIHSLLLRQWLVTPHELIELTDTADEVEEIFTFDELINA